MRVVTVPLRFMEHFSAFQPTVLDSVTCSFNISVQFHHSEVTGSCFQWESCDKNQWTCASPAQQAGEHVVSLAFSCWRNQTFPWRSWWRPQTESEVQTGNTHDVNVVFTACFDIPRGVNMHYSELCAEWKWHQWYHVNRDVRLKNGGEVRFESVWCSYLCVLLLGSETVSRFSENLLCEGGRDKSHQEELWVFFESSEFTEKPFQWWHNYLH